MGKSKAVLAFGFTVFAVEVQGDSIVVMVDPEADDAALTLKKVISMISQQRRTLFHDLEFTLLAVDPKSGSGETAVEYGKLSRAMLAGDTKVMGYRPRRGLQVADFAAFFDDTAGALDSDTEGPKASELTLLKELSSGLVNHVFISHIQSNGGDLADALRLKLENRKLKVWYDKAYTGELNKQAMLDGVQQSKAFLLLLTKGVFERPYVVAELRQAISAGKRVLFVHESETHRAGYAPFSHFIDTAPDKILFEEVQSLPIRRDLYEVPAFLTELIHRIDERE